MVAVGHVHYNYNNKSIHCLNHSGGDNHPESAARCGSHASLNERHLCWHSDPPLDRERNKGARCHSHLRPHGEAEKTVGSQAVACRNFCLGLEWSKIVTDMSTSYVSSRPTEGAKESPRPIEYRWPIDTPIDRLSIAIGQKHLLAYCLSQQPS